MWLHYWEETKKCQENLMWRICTHKMLVGSSKQESFSHLRFGFFFLFFLIPCHSVCKGKKKKKEKKPQNYSLNISENRIWWSESKHEFFPVPWTSLFVLHLLNMSPHSLWLKASWPQKIGFDSWGCQGIQIPWADGFGRQGWRLLTIEMHLWMAASFIRAPLAEQCQWWK